MFACRSFFGRVCWIVHGAHILRFRVSPHVYWCWIAVADVIEFGGAAQQIPLENGPRAARTATGANVTVTHNTVPIEVSLRTPWRPVKVPPITFAVVPGSDDVVLFGMATMKALGLDLYPWALEKLRRALCRCRPAWRVPVFLLRVG